MATNSKVLVCNKVGVAVTVAVKVVVTGVVMAVIRAAAVVEVAEEVVAVAVGAKNLLPTELEKLPITLENFDSQRNPTVHCLLPNYPLFLCFCFSIFFRISAFLHSISSQSFSRKYNTHCDRNLKVFLLKSCRRESYILKTFGRLS